MGYSHLSVQRADDTCRANLLLEIDSKLGLLTDFLDR